MSAGLLEDSLIAFTADLAGLSGIRVGPKDGVDGAGYQTRGQGSSPHEAEVLERLRALGYIQ